MCTADFAEWLTGIGTLLLALVATFQDPIRAWFNRAKLVLSIKNEPPDCMAVPETFTSIEGNKVNIPAVYLRVLVKNEGGSTALSAEIYANQLRRKREDGKWDVVVGFPPMNLTWSDVHGTYYPRIAPGMSKHCDVAAVYDPAALMNARLSLGAHLRSDQTCLRFCLITCPNHLGNIVGPGEYELDVFASADNSKPVKWVIAINMRSGMWYADQIAMLRDGVGISVRMDSN